ncbi:Fanconi anemia group J protein homolog isoform X2 [Macrosteles quadrilineatus]|nr:Fanconi anemia group J protein homolog isoform X2 [Macrosteles quadrilineatus]
MDTSDELSKKLNSSNLLPKEKGSILQENNLDPMKDERKGDMVDPFDEEPKKFKPPIIYYGTRTHKQIAQVVDQLKKTSHAKDIRMAILASRDFTCVNPTVKGKPRIADLCRECIDPAFNIGCTYYHGATKMGNHKSILDLGVPRVFDIEDIVAVGTRRRVCPYFTLRNIVKTSDIVFCPYNYLIHPDMRSSMNINLQGSIVILDEAHNIEDICRDTASLSLKSDSVAAAIKECREQQKHHMPEEYRAIEDYLVKLEHFIASEGPKCNYNNDGSDVTWPGFAFIERLHDAGITLDAYNVMLENVNRIEQAKSEDPEANAALGGTVKTVCSEIKCCFKHLYMPENKMKFQACFVREVGFKQTLPDNWFSKHRRNSSSGEREWKYGLRVVCLDPSLVFKELSSARTIILASGTLSPLDSFITELGVEFKHIVRGKHVVPPENLYVSTISNGPKGCVVQGTYNVIHEYYYQDEIGRIVLETSKIVPHGVLCFVPSYVLLSKLRERWTSNGILDELETVKEIFFEPKERDQMNAVMDDFNYTIDESRQNQAKGAILFGVYRGKIAEGVDFSDESARVVIAVGIPFQNKFSFEIKEKIKYNNGMATKDSNLLSGNKWYTIQAYRALNQALGRCIRHQNDWGAIVLVDSRFSANEVQESLPTWIRSKLRTFQSWNNYMAEIQQFCNRKNITQS